MSFKIRSTPEKEMIASNWNCFTPTRESNQLFLSNKSNQPHQQKPSTQRERRSSGSKGQKTLSQKISLRSKKDRSMRYSREITPIDSDSLKECRSPVIGPQIGAPVWGNTQDSLFYRPPSAPSSSRTEHFVREQKIPDIPSSIFSQVKTPPAPMIKFTIQSPRVQSKADLEIRTTLFKERANKKVEDHSLRTTILPSYSQSTIDKKEVDKSEREEKTMECIQSPPLLEESCETIRQPPKLSKSLKQEITQSLMAPQSCKEKKNAKELSYSCRNFASQRLVNLHKKVSKMSQVQEIKSLADSDEKNDSDKQSIVLGRLEEVSIIDRSSFSQGTAGLAERKQFKYFSSTNIPRPT